MQRSLAAIITQIHSRPTASLRDQQSRDLTVTIQRCQMQSCKTILLFHVDQMPASSDQTFRGTGNEKYKIETPNFVIIEAYILFSSQST